MPWKSPRSCRKTVVFTSRSRPLPASSRIARRFAMTCSVCSAIPGPTISDSPGRSASCPETKTRSPTRIACEYGAPWNGAGAASVRTTSFSATPLPPRLRQRDAERLEDRLQHVLGVLAVDEPHVHRQARALGELLEEPRDDVALEPRYVRRREVDVRDDERPPRDLERDVRQRLVGRHDRRAVPPRALRQRLGERAAQRAPRGRDLLVG